jgi:DNA-binding FadR family transcriptional regulator
MNYGPVPRRSSLCDEVIARLRHQITAGVWAVGARIPTETELVEQLGVARNTVREAVRALAHNGLLDIRQGSGTYVVATSELAAVMRRRFASAHQRDIVDVRCALEATAARLAASRRTAADLRRLEALLRRRERAWASGDPAAFVDADAAFHLAVVTAARNDVLLTLYADLGQVIRDSLLAHFGTDLDPADRMDHAGLVDAIRSRDADRAAAEAAAHTKSVRESRRGPELLAASAPPTLSIDDAR